jgi:hypothetical protein
MRGAFGPLQDAGVSGALTFTLEKTAQGTRLTLTYGVGGYYPGGLDAVAAPVDVVFTQQVTRLKDFVEKQPRR